jgi:very-short-patch-repair endonuclease
MMRRAASLGEETFAFHCRAYGLKPEREVAFAPGRKFRFDFLFPEDKLAIEIDGGTRTFGRHSRHGGITSDCVKYNLAVRLGYRVLRYTTEMVEQGTAINDVREILGHPIHA